LDNSLIYIKDIAVENLAAPILITIPLSIEFTDTTNNKTLGCGYMDMDAQMFKSDGVKYQMINRKLVTCQAYHLTAIGVEEYAVDKQSLVTADTAVVVASGSSNYTSYLSDQNLDLVDMWGSWAVYNSFIMFGLLLGGVIWGYQKDKSD
jgi:hypothetical protein